MIYAGKAFTVSALEDGIVELKFDLQGESVNKFNRLALTELREAVDAMDEETFQLYMKYHLSTCEREDLLGVSSHALDIFRKEQ